MVLYCSFKNAPCTVLSLCHAACGFGETLLQLENPGLVRRSCGAVRWGAIPPIGNLPFASFTFVFCPLYRQAFPWKKREQLLISGHDSFPSDILLNSVSRVMDDRIR